jgi:cation diffusion facilitator CzcD-associated flavoprotein CzcO
VFCWTQVQVQFFKSWVYPTNMFLSNWKWPKLEGLTDFKGQLLHSARWDSSYDFKGKKVAVIGNGSSGIQIVPKLGPGKYKIYHV